MPKKASSNSSKKKAGARKRSGSAKTGTNSKAKAKTKTTTGVKTGTASGSKAAADLKKKLADAKQQIAKLSSLIEASQVINSTLDLDEILPLILQTATFNLQADRGTLYVVDEERHEIWSKVKQGDEMLEIRLPVGQGLSGYVAQTGDEVLIDDAYEDPRFNQEVDRASGYRTKSVLTTPMRNKEGKIIGVFQLLNKAGGPFATEDIEFLSALSAHAALAIENAFLHQESLEKEALDKELNVARDIQQRLIPDTAPELEGYDLLGLNTPCDAVGGDYYDYIPLDDEHLLIALGDVVGHGVPASLLMANLYAALRSHAQYAMELSEMVAKANNFIHRSTDIMQYITMFCGILEMATGRFVYVNAGHNPPYHVHPVEDGEPALKTLREGGVPLGMMPDMAYESGETIMEKGDLLYLFTDGVTEAANEAEELLGEERLEASLKGAVGLDLHQIIHEVQVEIRAHAGDTPQDDDVTMVALQRLP
jgi:sigma-B regulation protein RsbU (phosphoserine phosphatase)